jgi:AraC family transcriptional regulator
LERAIATLYDTPSGLMTLEAELRLPAASVEIWQFELVEQVHNVLQDGDSFHLDLCLTPRIPDSGISFSDRSASNHFKRPGKIFVIPPGKPLRVKSGVGSQGAIICRLMVDPIRKWFDAEPEWTDEQLEASLDVDSFPIENLLLQLSDEVRHPGFATDLVSEAIATQIAVHLHRFYRGLADSPPSGGLTKWRLSLIDERLREAQRAPTLSELALLCKLSARQLSRAFRISRGISIGDYVAQQRIENAKRLLYEGASVKSVAYTMGFAAPSSFCYAFRKATGIPPHQYRTQAHRGG